MSHDFESLLKDARRTLPEPDAELTRGVRARLTGGSTGRRRWSVGRLAVVAVVLGAIGIGFGIGQWLDSAPVQAARPQGLFGAAFLPAAGWSTFQGATPQQGGSIAVAANVPLHAEDRVRPRGTLPTATLAALPPLGIVIVAELVPTDGSADTPVRRLPVRLADMEPGMESVGGRTLLVRRLSTRVDAYDLDVTVFFGSRRPAAGAVTTAQNQLERVVVEAPRVTISSRLIRLPSGLYEVEISGTVASPNAGESVEVQSRDCGPHASRFFRVVGVARTASGGSWRLSKTVDGIDFLNLPPNAYYRARWDGSTSETILSRTPIFVNARLDRRRRVVLAIVSSGFTGQSLRRKFVELQRKVEGTDRWVRVRRARLAPLGNVRGAFTASFTGVRTRGLTLRAFAPAATAAPCFTAGASEPFKS